MIADQVNALNRAREVAAVANLIRLAATSSSSPPETNSKMSSSSTSSPPPVMADAASPPPPPPLPTPKRISFSVDSLLSDVRSSSNAAVQQQQQQQAADLSTRSHQQHSSDEEDNKSLGDSDCCDMLDEDDEDVDIEEEGMSETSGDGPNHKMPSRPSPTLASMFHHPALGMHPSFINHPGLMRPAAAFGAGGPVGGPHGWPLPYGLAAAAWAQHASQFVTSKFLLCTLSTAN